MTATFVIVRHGNTFASGEAPRRIGARTDIPLVASGREQADALGRSFAQRGWTFDRILSSPLRRTCETAEAIRNEMSHDRPVELSTLLAEIDHGEDEDQSEDAVIARIGADALAAWETQGLAPPGWTVDREKRIAGWRRLFADRASGRTLLVTSNGAARFALLADPALAVQAARLPSLKLRTGAYGIIEAGDDGLRLIAWDERP